MGPTLWAFCSPPLSSLLVFSNAAATPSNDYHEYKHAHNYITYTNSMHERIMHANTHHKKTLIRGRQTKLVFSKLK